MAAEEGGALVSHQTPAPVLCHPTEQLLYAGHSSAPTGPAAYNAPTSALTWTFSCQLCITLKGSDNGISSVGMLDMGL